MTTDRLDWMRHHLTLCAYKPNWRLTLDITDGKPVLIARYSTTDSRNPDHTVRLKGCRALTPTTDPQAFTDDVLAQLDDIERHETREWFRYRGQLVDDPHADPTRWHCPCGGVGPPRREGRGWVCPCGKVEHR